MFLKPTFDFYDKTTLKSYNLDEKMRYQLNCLDRLDVYTRLHCENVASMVVRLCEYMKINKDLTEYITLCAYLHDIGKLFIPHDILQKPGKLTDDEYEIMKTHTTIGYKICLKDQKLRPYKAGAIYHHEALDGSGYPRGLKAPDIPLEGQIIRVADEYDAITSKRQYKTHIGICDSLKIITENTKPQPKKIGVISVKPKHGKNNPLVVRQLFKVVEDDIGYEISNLDNYLKDIKENLNRFDLMEKFKKKMDKARLQSNVDYYKAGIEELCKATETVENFQDIHKSYLDSYEKFQKSIQTLRVEIKQIHKLSNTI